MNYIIQILEKSFTPLANRLGWDRNYLLGVLNGWLVLMAEGFITPQIVLISFATSLDAPNTVLGLIPAILNGGWLLPQLITASRIRHLPKKIVIYQNMALIRSLSYLWIILSTILFAQDHALLLISFLLGLVINSLASGISGLPFLEVVAKTVPLKKRPNFFATRQLIGGLLALLAGVIVSSIFSLKLPFPYDYTVIFTIAVVIYTIGYALFGAVDEPDDPPMIKRTMFKQLYLLPTLFKRDKNFQKFILLRLLITLAAIADPFYMANAKKFIQISPEMIGFFVLMFALSNSLANPLWAKLAKNKLFAMQLAIICALLTPLIAIIMPPGAGLLYGLTFLFFGASQAGFNILNNHYLLGLAPNKYRSQYIGLTNTLVGVTTFGPVLGGGLADVIGYHYLFLIPIILLVIALSFSIFYRKNLT